MNWMKKATKSLKMMLNTAEAKRGERSIDGFRKN